MNISSVEASLFKYLYENFEVPLGIKIFENIYVVNFDSYQKWIVLDSLSHTTGSIPKAIFFLHISVKSGLRNETAVLNDLADKVLSKISEGLRIDVYDTVSTARVGEMEVCETLLAPIMQHVGGGSYRSLTVGVVYAGDSPT